jgi:L-alanine-DL-glutamate epimerase-like enolase superfamily enzyme
MKITSIELFHIAIPFLKPYKLSKQYGTLTKAQAVIFKVYTDEGIIGLGEADPMNPFTEETPASVMVITRDNIAPHLIGKDPTQITILESTLDQAVHGNWTAMGAINMALYDIIGKANNIPVHTLLGGLFNSRLPILSGVGSGTPEEDAAAIEEQIEQGYSSIMIKMGALPIADEIKRLTSAKERFGDQIIILVDSNQGWEVAETFEFLDGIKGYRPDLIEQPIKRWDIEGLKRIRARSPCPLCADESLVTIHDATTLIRDRAVDAFSIKVSKNGGLTKAKKIAQVANAFGLRCLMNSMLEFGITQAASLQLGCILTNLLDLGHAYGSVLRMSDDITDFGKNISRAVVSVPKGSGLGVSLDEEKLKKYTNDYLKIEN